MSNRTPKTVIQGFFQTLERLYRKITKRLVNWLFRHILIHQRRGKLSTTGFILPTTVLLILIVALTVGALTFRAYTRNTQVIGEAQQRVIYNAATPAIDRARSKLEFLFDAKKDSRLPAGVPSQDVLQAMLLNNGKDIAGNNFSKLQYIDPKTNQTVDDVYTYPDETRIDINGDSKLDNAWYFQTPSSSGGKDTIVYSLLMSTPQAVGKSEIATRLLQLSDKDKASSLSVRQAPISIDKAIGCSVGSAGKTAGPYGWFEGSTTAVLKKNFQVDALVIPANQNATKVTLEFSQDRQLDRGNKWGAWFRNDLEIYPGRPFNWNGAMHTEGSLIVGLDNFKAYLISSPSSCLYSDPSASEITVTNIQPSSGQTQDFLGLVAAGVVKDATITNNSATVHIHSTNPADSKNWATLNKDTSSKLASANLIDIALDPENVTIQDGYKNRKGDNNRDTTKYLNSSTADYKAFGVKGNPPLRISAIAQPAPYVDDLYRADDRWGPKPKYDNDNKVSSTNPVGTLIPSSNTKLLQSEPTAGDDDANNLGLDGYWERRARSVGMRILVGQRLELGNLFTWYAPQNNGDDYAMSVDKNADGVINQNEYEYEGDPLYPPTVKPYPAQTISHIDQFRRTLRDNLSAVQSAAIYHSAFANSPDEKDYPVACFAATSHPGTLTTLRQSSLFRPSEFFGVDSDNKTINGSLLTNFFTGVGTNGWEFEPPAGSYDKFKSAIADSGSPLRKALQNLANFAGDHISDTKTGAYPPTANDTVIHPYPALTMWGNFSNLKRTLTDLNNGKSYSDLSIADKTYLQTAACTLGMLAYNINEIQKFDPSNPLNDPALPSNTDNHLMAKLGRDLWNLMDGVNDIGVGTDPTKAGNWEVLPRGQLSTYSYSTTGSYIGDDAYNDQDYVKVPPEAYIGALRQMLLAGGKPIDDPEFVAEMRLAETIMLHHQIRRDRTFGFRPSPVFGYYAVQGRSANVIAAFPTACDPDEFVFTDGANADIALLNESRVGKSSTKLTRDGLAGTELSSKDPQDLQALPLPFDPNTRNTINLVRYRLALSRLCGTIDYTIPKLDASGMAPTVPPAKDGVPRVELATPIVLPKFPALYYLFPEETHSYNGAGTPTNLLQPETEPYIADDYVKSINAQFVRVSDTKVPGRAASLSSDFEDSRQVDPDLIALTQNNPNPFLCPSINQPGVFWCRLKRSIQGNQPPIPTPGIRIRRADRNVFSRYPVGDATYRGIDDDNDKKVLKEFFLNPKYYLTDGKKNRVFPTPDYSVSEVAIQPRKLDLTDWKLPYDTTPNAFATGTANFSTNLIVKADKSNTAAKDLNVIAVPFLERALFDGRQLMLARTLDIDLGMLRSNEVKGGAKKDVWLPVSGVVYAFREDAVREDAIARPSGSTTNVQNPAQPQDPAIPAANNGISTKSIDGFPDPDRRVHGFRLRNGAQVMRNRSFEGNIMDAAKNNKGLSFFTDQPVYIQGDFNLHQDEQGKDDAITNPLEEFTTLLPANSLYTEKQFYTDRTTRNEKFATLENDRWRPSEILADSISILSNNFCEGTIADTFVQPNRNASFSPTAAYPVPDFSVYSNFSSPQESNKRGYYHQPDRGLFAPGCMQAKYTSFHNQNRPNPTNNLSKKNPGKQDGWDWVRENSRYDSTLTQRSTRDGYTDGYWVDFAAPVKISRTGRPVIARPRDPVVDPKPLRDPATGNSSESSSQPGQPLPPIAYNQPYFGYGDNNDNRSIVDNNPDSAAQTQVNSIIVSGINPSRNQQGYGGLHNFPRFLENWNQINLRFAGSFIQLSYTNYATAPFELENLEPSGLSDPNLSNPSAENIKYYSPPNRLWGYDVALQFSPAGPAASRFVTASKNRNEFYVEPPASDPYIANLCNAVNGKTLNGTVIKTSCPAQ